MLADLLRDKTRPQILMMAAILLLFVSQFFMYLDDPDTGQLLIGSDFSTVGYYTFNTRGTGWELHPQAWVLIVVLGFAFFRNDVVEHPMFRRFGWIVAIILFFACTVPGAYLRAFGGSLGGISVLMALVAVLMHYFIRRPVVAEPPKA